MFNNKSNGGRRKKVQRKAPTVRGNTLRSTPVRLRQLNTLDDRKLTFEIEVNNNDLLRIRVEGGYSCVYSKNKTNDKAIGDVIKRYGGPKSGINFQNSFYELSQHDMDDE